MRTRWLIYADYRSRLLLLLFIYCMQKKSQEILSEIKRLHRRSIQQILTRLLIIVITLTLTLTGTLTLVMIDNVNSQWINQCH